MEEAEPPEIPWQVTARMFYANRRRCWGLVGFAVIAVLGLFGPAILQADPFAIVGAPLTEPGEPTLMGTDYSRARI